MTNVFLVGAPLLLLAYYVIVFFSLGTESTPPPVAPQYEPPSGFSAASVRLLWRGVADARSVAAVLADLCARRLISLEKRSSKYTVKRMYSQPTPLPDLPREENVVLDFLFANFYQETVFDPSRQSQGCASVIQGVLLKNMGSRYWNSHAGYVAIGVLGSCIAALALLLLRSSPHTAMDSIFVTVFIAAIALFGGIALQALQPLVRDIRQGTCSFGRIFLMLLLLGFLAMWFVLVATRLGADYSSSIISAIFAMTLLNLIAQPLLRRDTEEGKRLKRHIEGFRAFLIAVEQDQLDRMNRAKNEIGYAGHLPYAIALEVKEAWGDHLANELFPSVG